MGDWSTGERETVLHALHRAVEAKPSRVFLDFEGEAYTYEESWSAVGRLSRTLRELGVRRGDAVVTLLDNHADAIFLWFAANAIGAISVAVNTALKGEFLRHVLADTDARLVIAEADLVDRLQRVGDGVPTLERVLYRGAQAPDLAGEGGFKLEALDAYRADDADEISLDVRPQDLTCLVYTGGTTGPSKGCMISHNYICNNARRTLRSSGRTSDEVAWSALPIFHMNVTSLTILGSVLVQGTAAISKRFSLSGFWPEIERSGARVVNLLGSSIALIAKMDDTPEMARCRGQIRAVIGQPFPPELADTWRTRFGTEILGGSLYGMTEAVPITSLAAHEPARPGSCGKEDASFELAIFDDDDNPLGPGQVGEIVCRPRHPNVMFEGYWRRPEATAAACRNLWFHTGDLGRMDEDGYLYFVDRKKDYLRRRGENISSVEVESTLVQHPDINEVCVHAVPSEVTEDDVKVTAVLKPGATLAPEELFEWSVERLPYFALPRYIEFRDELPKSPTGRVLKFELRAEGCTPATWDREEAGVSFEKR